MVGRHVHFDPDLDDLEVGLVGEGVSVGRPAREAMIWEVPSLEV